jgi:hypothetical protein
LESPEASYVRVEGTEDIVDFEICTEDDQRLNVSQAMRLSRLSTGA